MGIEFKDSETKKNLLRAVAGECQARMRYTMGASEAKNQEKYVLYAVLDRKSVV